MKKILLFLGLLIYSSITWSESPKDIVKKVIDRDDGITQFAEQIVATCSYKIKDKSISCVENPRIKLVELATKDYGTDGKDKKTIMIILEPPVDRGIGFLQYDYVQHDKESEQWMYLSAFGKVKRIVSGNSEEPKTGALFGSEFNYEDTESLRLDDYTYSLISEEEYQGRACWVIQYTPTNKHVARSNYSKILQWIDKERYIIIKSDKYDRRGALQKQMTRSDFVKLNNIWVNRRMDMNNIQTKRISVMKMNKMILDVEIDDQFMTERSLTDSAFREFHLQKLRTVAN